MSNTIIVTDSTADIPQELVDRLGIVIVPLTVMFGNTTYLDGIEMSAAQFYSELVRADELPTTSQPSPARFLETFTTLLEQHPESQIVSIHLSSGVSGTYQSALLGKSMLEKHEDRITVLDSKLASYGYGMLVVYAAELAASGHSPADIVQALEHRQERLCLYFLVDTLEYLQKGGRIGKAAAMIGTLLNIKPILSMDKEGIIYSADKARGHKKATARIIELLERDLKGQKINIAVGHTADRSAAEAFEAQLAEHFELGDRIYTEVGAVIGTHVGPGTIAIFAWPAGDER
ncbi:EDD domain protein [Paenibacillus sp. IHB B 3084]|uniref:DegV family protein n=1 Tax=Paenibacillus TaxID=44249 RepID=UPI0007215198|nr:MULTISPECIES: DegV family protein [Paenibacillus]ALP38540.1 EDD domain protein [Paenibacillus sp. IHB B 3084]MBE0339314.1 DegV family protein [Paenibacillus sp. 23TSA30-6]